MTQGVSYVPQPLIMGILNTTPDSFSDGGRFVTPEQAYRHGMELIESGADILDIGGESSRPGATSVSIEEEWRRVLPSIRSLSNKGVALSIDTYKPEIMRRATEEGITYINDIRGGSDAATLAFLAKQNVGYIAMHMQGTPRTMQSAPLMGASAREVVGDFFRATTSRLAEAGFKHEAVWLDPGIGFGKTTAANLRLLAEVPNWSKVYNLTIGVSRKSLFGKLFGIEVPKDRDPVSKMVELGAGIAGAKMIRTHAVRELKMIFNQMRADE